MSYCLWKLFFDSNLPQTPSNLIYLIFLVTFTLFQPKLEAIKWQKVLNIALLGTVFPILSLRLKFGIKRISSLFLGERRARGGACGTSNYRNPVRKFPEFSFTEPIKWKTPSPANCSLNVTREETSNSINCKFLKSKVSQA